MDKILGIVGNVFLGWIVFIVLISLALMPSVMEQNSLEVSKEASKGVSKEFPERASKGVSKEIPEEVPEEVSEADFDWKPPEGYNFYLADNGFLGEPTPIGWRWLRPEEFECTKFGSCWGIEVIPSNSCDFIYAEVVFFDGSDRNIDYEGDTASGVRTEQKAVLTFITYKEAVQSAHLKEITCRQN